MDDNLYDFFQGGKLQIFDVAAGTLLETIDAHQGAVWSVSLSPDKVSCCLLGSHDGCIIIDTHTITFPLQAM